MRFKRYLLEKNSVTQRHHRQGADAAVSRFPMERKVGARVPESSAEFQVMLGVGLAPGLSRSAIRSGDHSH
jgi:hypothetical protein